MQQIVQQKGEAVEWKLPTEDEIRELAKRAKVSENRLFLIQNDLATLQNQVQALVNQNNQIAERALKTGDSDDALLIEYAAQEQNIADTYNYLLLRYEGVIEESVERNNYRVSFYFDNYFVDFENNLKEAKKDREMKPSHHHYFIKMYRTTQDKLATLYKIYLDNTRQLKKQESLNQQTLIEIREEKRRYKVAYDSVLDEFVTYATTFLEALESDAKEYEVLQKKITALQERYSV